MASINKVILVGNLGQDPEVKYMPSGGAVTNLSIATTDKWKDKNSGEEKSNTEWHRAVLFNRLAEIAGEYLRKGSQVYIEGNLRTRSWEDNGVKKYATEIVAREMQMLGSRSNSDGSGGQSSSSSQGGGQRRPAGQTNGAPQQQAPQNFDNFDDDIPF